MSGHDYRPAYLSLQKLKVLFPTVPILAVTATGKSGRRRLSTRKGTQSILRSSFERHRRHDQDARTTKEDVSWRCCSTKLDDPLHASRFRPCIPRVRGIKLKLGVLRYSAPLYRPNLNWSVVAKPQKADQATSAIIDWILENHEGETGIIYCLVSSRLPPNLCRSRRS